MDNETKTLDLDSLDPSLIAEELDEIDVESNPMGDPRPVMDGWHRVKFQPLQTNQVAVKTTSGAKSPKTEFFNFNYSLAIADDNDPENNRRIFGRVNTLIFDGKSEINYIIRQALGGGDDAKDFVKTLKNYVLRAQAFKDVTASEAFVEVKTKWEAQYKTKDKDGKDVYKTVKSGMKNFPKVLDQDGKWNGTYSPVYVVNPGTESEEEISARATIVDFRPAA